MPADLLIQLAGLVVAGMGRGALSPCTSSAVPVTVQLSWWFADGVLAVAAFMLLIGSIPGMVWYGGRTSFIIGHSELAIKGNNFF